MAEKAVIIGLFGSLLCSAGLLWAKMPPRPEIYSTHVKQISKEPRAEVRVIPIDPPAPELKLSPLSPLSPAEKEVLQETRDKLTPEPKEVMPSDIPDIQYNRNNNVPDTRPRQVPIPKRRPVGAVNRPHCPCKKKHRRPVFVLPQANGGML